MPLLPLLVDWGGVVGAVAAGAAAAGALAGTGAAAPGATAPGDGLSVRVNASRPLSDTSTVTGSLFRSVPIAWNVCLPGSTGKGRPTSAGGTCSPSMVTATGP